MEISLAAKTNGNMQFCAGLTAAAHAEDTAAGRCNFEVNFISEGSKLRDVGFCETTRWLPGRFTFLGLRVG